MIADIRVLSEKKLIGQRIKTSLADDKTFELWRGFMPRKKEINSIGSDLFSIQVYETTLDINTFNPHLLFEKWAAVEVMTFDSIPEGMETFNLKGGLYAVFIHKGAANTGAKTFQFIFGTWLPNSGYGLDNRPHFEILGEKYKNNSPDSEEEIWIPIKPLT